MRQRAAVEDEGLCASRLEDLMERSIVPASRSSLTQSDAGAARRGTHAGVRTQGRELGVIDSIEPRHHRETIGPIRTHCTSGDTRAPASSCGDPPSHEQMSAVRVRTANAASSSFRGGHDDAPNPNCQRISCAERPRIRAITWESSRAGSFHDRAE
jgi:hypothetical protein